MCREFCQHLIGEEEFYRLEQPVEGDVRRTLEQELVKNPDRNAISLWETLFWKAFSAINSA